MNSGTVKSHKSINKIKVHEFWTSIKGEKSEIGRNSNLRHLQKLAYSCTSNVGTWKWAKYLAASCSSRTWYCLPPRLFFSGRVASYRVAHFSMEMITFVRKFFPYRSLIKVRCCLTLSQRCAKERVSPSIWRWAASPRESRFRDIFWKVQHFSHFLRKKHCYDIPLGRSMPEAHICSCFDARSQVLAK